MEIIPLTIIIPVYGRQHALDRALRSISRQDVSPHQVIVVDDGSMPPLQPPAELDLGNLLWIRQALNSGPAAARNAALRHCETEWVSFLDSDDFLLPNTLGARWRDAMEQQRLDRNTKVIYGCAWLETEAGKGAAQVRRPRSSSEALDFASGCWFSPGSCVILNKNSAIEAAGYQDESLRRLEDLDWFLRLGLAGFRLDVRDFVGAVISRHRPDKSAAVLDSARRMEEKWSRSDFSPEIAARLRSYLHLECAAAYHYSGRPVMSAAHMLRSLLLVPRLTTRLSPGWDVSAVDEGTMAEIGN